MAESSLCNCFHSLRSTGCSLSSDSTLAANLHCQRKVELLLPELLIQRFPRKFRCYGEEDLLNLSYLKLGRDFHILHSRHYLLC
jgi:hypothetical protein